jgi:hypothetical protein
MLTYRLTFNSPPLTLYLPALRVGAGKSGVGEGEWKVSSMQISVLFQCHDPTFLHRAPPPSGPRVRPPERARLAPEWGGVTREKVSLGILHN